METKIYKGLKNISLAVLFLIINLTALQAQEETTQTETKNNNPVSPLFESGYLIDNQTTRMYSSKTLEYVIHHRFGTTDKGITDLYGIYSTSNVRMGINYSLTDYLQLGIGTTRNKKYQDLQWKVKIFDQTQSNSSPVNLVYFGNVAIDARDEAVFGKDYKFIHRISYFNELIVGRSFNRNLSVQASLNFTHYNIVDSLLENDKLGISVSGRYKISPQSALFLQYNMPLHIGALQQYDELTNKPLPVLALGWEIATSTHAFHIFIASGNGILPQENYAFNQLDFTKSKWLIGFNITRLWFF
ncbi:MAG: DUF5777 family beta-barrel protein [Bacteroidales bacterium]